VILAAQDVVDLQFFLMDGVKRYIHGSGQDGAAADDLLASAAALDYALLLSSERANEALDPEAPVAQSVRETMTRASLAALDLVDRLVRAPDEQFSDFVHRLARGGIFEVLQALRARDVVTGCDIAFRTVTATSDIAERRRRGG